MRQHGMPYRDICGKCGARRIDRQIGLEATPEEYVATMVAVFREVRRVLRDDGTVWLNLGDSYATGGSGGYSDKSTLSGFTNPRTKGRVMSDNPIQRSTPMGLKPKDLCGIPWRVAFALQADGWYLRSDIIWAKPAPMPESVTDRPTRSHEYIFLLSKSERYFYDSEAIREEAAESSIARISQPNFANQTGGPKDYSNGINPSRSARKALENFALNPGRNKRSVWTVNSEPCPDAHFATFPSKLIEPCILAGTSEKGCCAQCGAPRVRELERTFVGSYHDHKKDGVEYGLRQGGKGPKSTYEVPRTTGWRASCSHDASSVPCVVLDPFIGSGTVGKVCERLGRRWAGLELSAAYLGIATKRTAQRGLGL